MPGLPRLVKYLRLVGAVFLVAVGVTAMAQATNGSNPAITVYKSPTCGCCEDWVKHLQSDGFEVAAHDRNDMNAIKSENGVLRSLASCHTALVDGYVIEGHVPAADIRRLLAERPDVHGLTAPGMPKQSPGMQPPGKRPQGYDVLAFDAGGYTQVFSHY